MVDVEVLKRYIGDDAEAITEFLGEFRKSVLHHAVQLERGVGVQEMELVHRSAHSLKSTARAAGATSFGDVLAELERAAARQEVESMNRYYADFQRMVPLVLASLDVLVPPP